MSLTRTRPNWHIRLFPRRGRDCTWTTTPRWLPINVSCGRQVPPDASDSGLCEEHRWRMDNGIPLGPISDVPPESRWLRDMPVIPASAADYAVHRMGVSR